MSETKECPDCGEEFSRLSQHLFMSDCEGDTDATETVEMETFVADDQLFCDDCEQPITKTVTDVTESPYNPRRVEISESVVCECGGYVLDVTTAPKVDIPSGWE